MRYPTSCHPLKSIYYDTMIVADLESNGVFSMVDGTSWFIGEFYEVVKGVPKCYKLVSILLCNHG
jgi:hypothetical protein